MLEFTFLGYSLHRSFKLRIAHGALSPTTWHRQLCQRETLSGPELNVGSGRGGSTPRATRNLNEERRRL